MHQAQQIIPHGAACPFGRPSVPHLLSSIIPALVCRNLAPAAAQVRNDYGYALLLVGRYEDAAFELRTALELANGQGPVRQNVAVAYLLTDNEKGLQTLKSEYGFTADEMAYAEKLREQFGRVLK